MDFWKGIRPDGNEHREVEGVTKKFGKRGKYFWLQSPKRG